MERTRQFKGGKVGISREFYSGGGFGLLFIAGGAWEGNLLVLLSGFIVLFFFGVMGFAVASMRIPTLTIGPEVLVWGGHHLPLATLEVGPIGEHVVFDSREKAFALRGPNVFGKPQEVHVVAHDWPHFEEMHQEISRAVAARKAR